MPTNSDNKEKEKVWFREARHVEEIKGAMLEALKNKDDWRKIRERMKTVSVALVLCLNVGTDPPDVQKPHPCARKEAWIDPSTSNPQISSQKIAQSLQKIYEKLQPRARYKSAIDPTVDCVRKLCTSMRRNAKDERVLFHFNGHGVPRPTEAGEIWVFNKNITQYIPLSLYDLQSWMGVPSVYLWDCNSAGTIVNMFMRFAEDHSIRCMDDYGEMRSQDEQAAGIDGMGPTTSSAINDHHQGDVVNAVNDAASNASTNSTIPSYKNCIQLGSCAAGEQLPFHCTDLPADLFTCCLTTPIQTSLLCHMLKTGTKNRFPANIIDEIPGALTDRRTLLGELNWIFTAITDTIAWSCLPMDTFQKLFRQDLLIASLFRSFLLAERVMRENGCRVVSTPQLPSVHAHPLWEYWDYTLDLCLSNMYNLLQPKQNIIQFARNDCFVGTTLRHNLLIEYTLLTMADTEYAYSWFFIEQLQAFEVWLKFGVDKKEPPQQLPVVLQNCLFYVHRVRALELLARFVDLGPWAVVSALSVGIFPYVLKLLQCGTKELRPALAFIWAKILAIDPVCQHELVKDNGYFYFLQVLNDPSVSPRMKIISAFVMATIIYNNYRPAQEKLVQSDYVTLCIELLSNEQVARCRMLCLWLLIGLGRLWADYDKARWQAIRNVAYDKVIEFLNDDVPEVRAAAVYALGCFVHNTSRDNEHATAVENEVCDKLCERCTYDGSVLVRAELAAAIQWFVIDFQSRFAAICAELDRRVATGNTKIKVGNGAVQGDVELTRAMVAMCLSPTESAVLLAQNTDTPSAAPSRKTSRSGYTQVVQFTHHANVHRSASNSVHSIVPRSASSILHTASSLRGRLSPVRRKTSTFSSSDGAVRPPSANSTPDSESLFKFRVLSHIRALESKTFIGPFERIWLCVLRLGLDPFDGVAAMGEQIINYIFELSFKIKDVRDRALELNRHSGRPLAVNGPIGTGTAGTSAGSSAEQRQHSNPVKFLVGTPQAAVPGSMLLSATAETDMTGGTGTTSGSSPMSTTPADKKTSISEGGTSTSTDGEVVGSNKMSSSGTPVESAVANSAVQALAAQMPQQKQEMDNVKRRLLMDPFIHQSLYTPKRSLFGTKSGAYAQANDTFDALLAEQSATLTAEGLVKTSFVDWSGKTWTEPIYDTIFDEQRTRISMRNSLVDSESPFTLAQPTDWAIHTHEGIRQRAKKEVEVLKAKQFRCETQIMQIKFGRPATSLVWSFLRPYVYICDGDYVRLYGYPTSDDYQQQQNDASPQQNQQPMMPPPSALCSEFLAGAEPFLQDSVTELMVANELTHELLMTGSSNGLLKVWDPMFSEHSHALLQPPKLIAATYLLNDVPRFASGKGSANGNRTIYRWDQGSGRLICSGNVRLCRIWDAWAEKAIYDVPLKHPKGTVTTVGSELRYDLVSCGFSDGTISLFDTRVPSDACEVLHVRDSNAPVIGMAMMQEREQLLVGTRDGDVRLWEPRMYNEAIVEFNVNKLKLQENGSSLFGNASAQDRQHRLLHRMEVQTSGEIIACAMDDASVFLFDIDGRGGVLSRSRYANVGGRLAAVTSFYSPASAAVSGIASLLRRRRNSSGGSNLTSGSSTTTENTTQNTTPQQPTHLHHQQPIHPPTAMRFHQSRVLLGIANFEGQFRATAMPGNIEPPTKKRQQSSLGL